MIVELGLKLRMFGVRLEGPAYFFCDNHVVVKNMSIPESVLHKKQGLDNHNSVSEAVAADIILFGKDDGYTNLEYLLTKVMAGQKNWDL